MVKLISSQVAARKTIKVLLQSEIPPINEAIEKAADKGEFLVNYGGKISEPTIKLLKRHRYHVDTNGETVDISWYQTFKKFSNNSETKKIAKELADEEYWEELDKEIEKYCEESDKELEKI